MAWILEPISIATEGVYGIAPGPDFCPLPLALGSSGIIRFEVDLVDRRDGDGGTGIRVIQVETIPAKPKVDPAKIALAILAIEEMYD